MACFQYAGALGAEANKAIHLKVGYASITGNRIPLWATQDREFFARNGLDAELIFIASSSQGMPALLAGQIPIYSGSLETAAQAAAAGADLVVIASSEPTQYKLIVQPGIKSAADLKGKKVGIDRVGGASYYATRRMLEKLGLKPDDVEYMHVVGGGNQKSRRLSLGNTERGGFQSSALSGPASRITLADATEMGIRIIGNSYITTRTFRDQNRDTVQRFITALLEGTQWVKNPKNRTAVLGIVKRRLRTDDPAVLDLNYRMYVEPLTPFPYTKIDDIRANLADLAESNPSIRNLNLAAFVDNSFVQRARSAKEKKWE